MSKFRKLHIASTTTAEYQYNIGKTGVKIIYPSGVAKFVKHHELLGWSPEQVSEARKHNVLAITPKTVKDFLLGKGTPVVDPKNLVCQRCGHQGSEVTATYDPFMMEIHQKSVYIVACQDCLDDIAAEI